jgi:hypothetical protein
MASSRLCDTIFESGIIFSEYSSGNRNKATTCTGDTSDTILISGGKKEEEDKHKEEVEMEEKGIRSELW